MRVGVTLRTIGEKSVLWLKIAVLVVAGIMPALTFNPVEAAQLQSRQVTISTSEIGASPVQHEFSFNMPNTSATKAGIIYEFCTTPLGTCSLPAGMSVASATHVSQSNTWPNDTEAFAPTTADVGDCVETGNPFRICFDRDETVATGTTGGAVTHTITGITAPSAADTVYIRIYIYSDDDFGSGDLLDEGVVASAYTQQLTVTGRVAERLEFCVGAMLGGGTPDGTPANCAAMTTNTEIAIGTIDHNAIYTTPVIDNGTNLANERYGAAMVNTNASGGVAITYFSEPASSVNGGDTDQLRSFRVVPTDCSSTISSVTDQCFVSATDTGGVGEVFAAGTEKFGMHIACVDGTQGTTTDNLTATINTAYDNDPLDAATALDFAANCQETATEAAAEFGFNDSGTPVQLVASNTVVDDEMIKVRFGATASATTPEGSYLVILTYVATPTF